MFVWEESGVLPGDMSDKALIPIDPLILFPQMCLKLVRHEERVKRDGPMLHSYMHNRDCNDPNNDDLEYRIPLHLREESQVGRAFG